jgi:nucleotide-binding universal stress UspA family protein
MEVDIELVLAPADTSEAAEQAVEYAVAVAERYGADLHLLYVLDQRVARGIDAGDVAPESVADGHRAFTAAVRRQLPETVALSHSATAGFSADRLSQTPGSVVLNAAEELDADFLVVPREGELGRSEATLGKAALYVLKYASQPVLSV